MRSPQASKLQAEKKCLDAELQEMRDHGRRVSWIVFFAQGIYIDAGHFGCLVGWVVGRLVLGFIDINIQRAEGKQVDIYKILQERV